MADSIELENSSNNFYFCAGLFEGIASNASNSHVFNVMHLVTAAAIATRYRDCLQKDVSSDCVLYAANTAIVGASQVVSGTIAGVGAVQLCKGLTNHSFALACLGIIFMSGGAVLSSHMRNLDFSKLS